MYHVTEHRTSQGIDIIPIADKLNAMTAEHHVIVSVQRIGETEPDVDNPHPGLLYEITSYKVG